MPPKAQKKPAAPKKPTKPSAKSKTGNTACSQAASNWQLAIRGKEPLDPQTYATLAKCRSMTRTAKQADDRARMGYNLNEQGAAALKGRLQKRFDQGLITQKSRDERLKMLLQQRKAKQAAVAAKPATQTAEKLTGTRAVAQRFENAENKFVEHAMNHAGLTRPQAVTALNAMTKAKAVKIDPVMGQFSFTHGAFGDKAVIRRAAGIEPAKPAKQADSLGTAESYIGNAIQANRYADRLKSNPSAMAAFRQTTLDKWKSGVLEQAKTGRLSDDVLDSYESQFGRGSVGKTFRGVYEKGASGYFTKDIRTNQKPADKAADLVKKVRELPKYTLAKSRAKANQKKISDLMSNPQDFLVQRGKYRSENATYANRSATERFRGKNAVADAISDLKERRRERAEGDLTLGQRRAMQKPADKAASLVSSVRQKPGYGVARASAAGNRELVGLKMRDKGQVTTQPAFTLKQSSNQGGTGAGRSMGVLFQTEGTALDKAAQAGQKAPLPGQTSLFEKKPAFSRQGQLAPGRGTEERKKAAGILQNLRSRNNDGRALARTIRNDAVFTRRWNDKKHLISSDAGFKSRRILEQSYQQRVNAEAGYTDAQHAANKLVTKTGKVKESAIREANIEYGSNVGLKQNAIAKRLGSLRDSASRHLNNYRMLKQAGVSETSYIAKPKSTKEFLKNPLSRLRNAITNRK